MSFIRHVSKSEAPLAKPSSSSELGHFLFWWQLDGPTDGHVIDWGLSNGLMDDRVRIRRRRRRDRVAGGIKYLGPILFLYELVLPIGGQLASSLLFRL